MGWPSFLDPGVQEFANRLSNPKPRDSSYFQADTGRPGVLAGFRGSVNGSRLHDCPARTVA